MKFFIFLFISFSVLFADIGSVSMLKGDVKLTRDGEASRLNLGDNLQEGDKINTYDNSRLQIILEDDTVISIGNNSEYVIESYSDGFRPNMEARLNRGFLRTISGEIGKVAPERFKLKTKNSTIGIRGTGWLSYVSGETENYLCFSGTIVVNTPDGVYTIPAGYMLLGQNGKYKKLKADMRIFNSRKNLRQDLKSEPFSTPKLNTPQSAIGYIDSELEVVEDIPEYSSPRQYSSPQQDTQPMQNYVLKQNSTLTVTAIGQGVAPTKASSPALAVAMAKRAAIIDGYRVLAEKVNGVYVEGQDTIKNMAIKRSQVLAIVQNASVVSGNFKEGLYEVELEVELDYNYFK
jgi:hypothetical protein